MSFKDLLAKPAEAVEAPKPLPIGTYDFLIKSFAYGESSQKKTPYVRFACIPMSAHADVDSELLTDYGPINKREFNLDFYLTEDAIFRLKEFCEALGLNTKLSFEELIQDHVPNKTITATVTHTLGREGRPYSNIDKVLGEAK